MSGKAGEGTRARLLTAARQEFAEYGIAGARVDRIAALAGVNKERIYGYFGNKQKLFDEVVAQALDELAEAVPLRPGDDPAEYVGRVYDFHHANSDLVRLLLWEALHYRDDKLPDEARRTARYDEKTAALAETVGHERTPAVAACLLSLIGLAAWPDAVPQMTRMILGDAAAGAEGSGQLRGHLVGFARRAMDGLPGDTAAEPTAPRQATRE